jgi:glycosyltransferase involved in cell wall biosynthesis
MTLSEPAAAPAVLPLISCIMPTRGRPRFVAQSIAYFRRQDYPNRELIIVYEDDADLPEGLDDRNIRTVRTTQGIVGVKREEAARAARGEIIAHWDDDDWYAPQRLSRQALPILQGVADITGLNDLLFMSIAAREFWAVTAELFRRLFVGNISGGTLMFRRDVWRRSGPYPARSLREDADFMVKSMQDGARLCPVPGRDLCVYVRHGRNTWKFAEGRYLLQSDWSLTPEPDFLAADRSFYFGPSPRPLTSMRAAEPRTLVSCIMPTANRRAFIAQAVSHFLKQDYPERELIVVDDGEDPVADMIPDENSIRYVRLDRRVSIGAKRNIACELARGGVIAHWDDDDWMVVKLSSRHPLEQSRRNMRVGQGILLRSGNQARLALHL